MNTPYRSGKRALPMLESVQVASPCSAEWSEMVGDDRVRFCGSCEKHVYNLSAMQAEDAERLLAERAGKDLCVRFYQRADGTVMTSDCPVGVTRKRRKKVALAVAGAGAMAFGAFASVRAPSRLGEPMPVHAEVAMTAAPPVPPILGSAVPAMTAPPAVTAMPVTRQPEMPRTHLMGAVAVEPPPPVMGGARAPVQHTMGKPAMKR